MILIQFESHWRLLLKFAETCQHSLKDWIRREVIDDDPYDEEALLIQKMIETNSNTKPEVSELGSRLRAEALVLDHVYSLNPASIVQSRLDSRP